MAVAFTAAAALHGILLISFSEGLQGLHPQDHQSMQIELVKGEAAAISGQSAKKPDAQRQERERNVTSELAHREAPYSTPERQSEALPETVAYEAGAIPPDVRSRLLARIGYPLMARRNGWQGVATLHIGVKEQQLASLDLYRSSGYPLLDRAAMEGVRGIGELPLRNGLYQLPVEFRLQ